MCICVYIIYICVNVYLWYREEWPVYIIYVYAITKHLEPTASVMRLTTDICTLYKFKYTHMSHIALQAGMRLRLTDRHVHNVQGSQQGPAPLTACRRLPYSLLLPINHSPYYCLSYSVLLPLILLSTAYHCYSSFYIAAAYLPHSLPVASSSEWAKLLTIS